MKIYTEYKVVFLLDSPKNDKYFIQKSNTTYFLVIDKVMEMKKMLFANLQKKSLDALITSMIYFIFIN